MDQNPGGPHGETAPTGDLEAVVIHADGSREPANLNVFQKIWNALFGA